jgi:hypothetical protein
MRSTRLRRPSPGLLVAALALFVALGGTGYAATHSGSAPTKSQVKKLIASYVNAHKAQLTGPQGSAGTNGTPGQPGAAGPGAIPIVASATSPETTTAANVGPWKFTLICSGSPPNASMVVNGPGRVQGTGSISVGANPASSAVLAPLLADGFTQAVNNGAQLSNTLFLERESALYQVNTEITATTGGLFSECSLVGDAIPVP